MMPKNDEMTKSKDRVYPIKYEVEPGLFTRAELGHAGGCEWEIAMNVMRKIRARMSAPKVDKI